MGKYAVDVTVMTGVVDVTIMIGVVDVTIMTGVEVALTGSEQARLRMKKRERRSMSLFMAENIPLKILQ